MSAKRKKDNADRERGDEGRTAPMATAPHDERLQGLPNEVIDLIEELRAERDEAQAARMRSLADFKNYQRRSVENEARALESGKARVVRELLPVLDQFELALRQDAGQMTIEQLVAGVNMVRQELDKALQSSGLTSIVPEPGSEFDPQKHEAVMHQPSDEHPSGSVINVFQSGYMLDDLVLRPAKVVIASERGSSGGQEQRNADV